MWATSLASAAVFLASATLIAADAPPTADALLAAAQSQATAGRKTVFLMFHASW